MIRDPSLVLYLPLYKLDGTSIMSQDAYGKTFARTNAAWRLWGANFAGDGVLKLTEADYRSSDSAGTIIVWVKASTQGADIHLVTSCDEAANTRYFTFKLGQTTGYPSLIQRNNDVSDSVNVETDCADGTWHMMSIRSSGTAFTFNVDGGDKVINVAAGADNGDWLAETAARDNLSIGAFIRDTSAYATCDMGEVWIYSRALTPQEILHNYLATKHRYK